MTVGRSGSLAITRRAALIGGVAAPFVSRVAHAANDAKELKIALQAGLGYMSVVYAENKGLLKEELVARGLGDLAISYPKIGSSAGANDALISGAVDVVVSAVPSLLLAWDKTKGRSQEIIGLMGCTTLPLTLVTLDPAIKTVTDFKDQHKIALQSVIGTPAFALRVALENALGTGQHAKLDANMVGMPHLEAMQAVQSGVVAGYFGSPPFVQLVLDNPQARVVTRTREIYGGPNTFVMFYGARAYAERNPKVIEALHAAMRRANQAIDKDPKAAAEFYLGVEPSSRLNLAMVEKILRDPESGYETEVYGIGRMADIMQRRNNIKTRLKDWKELMHPIVHDTASN